MADSGSSESLHESAQWKAFVSHTGRPHEIRRVKGGGMSFLGGRNKITASVAFEFPLNSSIISFYSLETYGDAPLLLGARDMHWLGMEYLTNLYAIRCGSTLIPIVRDQGHLFIRWHFQDTSTFFTLSELNRLQCAWAPWMAAPSSFLKCATPDILDANSQKSFTWNRSSMPIMSAHRCCTSIFSDSGTTWALKIYIIFLVDLFWLDGRACIFVMDRDTNYTLAMFVHIQIVAGIWETIQRCWLLLYLGPPPERQSLQRRQKIQKYRTRSAIKT